MVEVQLSQHELYQNDDFPVHILGGALSYDDGFLIVDNFDTVLPMLQLAR